MERRPWCFDRRLRVLEFIHRHPFYVYSHTNYVTIPNIGTFWAQCAPFEHGHVSASVDVSRPTCPVKCNNSEPRTGV